MKKGLVLPIAGIVMFVISVVAVYVLAQQDGNFTKEVILKGEVAASNLNELEMIRKMLPMTMESIGKRAAYETLLDGCKQTFWTSITNAGVTTVTPSIETCNNYLITNIKYRLPTGTDTGNYDRTIKWSNPTITVSSDTIDKTYYDISGSIGFTLEDKIIKSEATSSVSLNSRITTSYFTLYDVGKSLFTNTYYQSIINSNLLASARATQLDNQLEIDYPTLDFTILTISDTKLKITIKDPQNMVWCNSVEVAGGLCPTSSTTPLTLNFMINIPARIIVYSKENPLTLRAGVNYDKMTPYVGDVIAGSAPSCVDRIEGPDPTQTYGWGVLSGSDILDPNTLYNIYANSDCSWPGDY